MRVQKQVLAGHLKMAVAKGARIEAATEDSAVIVCGQPVNHLLHFFIGLFTCGAWWIVWLLLALTGRERREVIHVDQDGTMHSA